MKKLLIVITVIFSIVLSSQAAFAVTIDTPTDGATLSSKPATFSGTALPNAEISLKEDGSEIATTTADANGDWSISTSNISDGEHEYTAESTSSGVWAFMNPSRDGRVDVVDVESRNFATSFFVPESYIVNDIEVNNGLVFVLATNFDTTTCEIFVYDTNTLEELTATVPIVISNNCSAANFDISSDATAASVLFYNPVEDKYFVSLYDVEDIEPYQEIELDNDFGGPLNTMISTVQSSLYVHYSEGLERFTNGGSGYSVVDDTTYDQPASTTAVLTNGEGYLIFGDSDENIMEVQAGSIDTKIEHFIATGSTFNVVGASSDSAFFYAAGYNGDNYSLWEWSTGTNSVVNESIFDQYPESFGVSPDGSNWIVGDNHSFGFIYFGSVNSAGVEDSIQYDGSSYRMSSDDFFSADEEHIIETTIATTNNLSEVGATTFSDGSTTKTVAPGGKVTITGSGYLPNSQVTITLNSTPVLLATLQTSSAGSFSTQVTIPKNTTLGAHTLVIAGTGANGNPRTSILNLNVAQLPATGANTFTAVVLAIMIIAIGAGTVLLSRKNSGSPEPPKETTNETK